MEEGFQNGTINLNRPQPVYYAGELLFGTIDFVLREPLNYSAIKIIYFGESKVCWQEQETEEYNGQRRVKTVTYEGNQIHFRLVQTLSGGTAGMSQLPPGKHSIPFSYLIPHGAPSSFRGEKGEVSYSIRTFVESSYPRTQQEIKLNFEVISPRDLNAGNMERLRSPIDMEFEEFYSCSFLCSAKPVSVKVHVPVSGFCPGQAIPISVRIDNQSAYEIKKMIFQLTQKERYVSRSPPSEYISEEKVLASVTRGAVLTDEVKEIRCSLVVPAMIAVNLESCEIIDLGYFLKVTFKLAGCNEDITDEAELCLGLVPLNETASNQYVHPLQHLLPPGPLPDPNQRQYIPPVELYNGVNSPTAPPPEDPVDMTKIGFRAN